MEVGFVVQWWHILLAVLGLFFLIGLYMVLRFVSKVHSGASSIINKAQREFHLVNDDWEQDLKMREGRHGR